MEEGLRGMKYLSGVEIGHHLRCQSPRCPGCRSLCTSGCPHVMMFVAVAGCSVPVAAVVGHFGFCIVKEFSFGLRVVS